MTMFRDGHEDEILGTFVGYNVSPTLMICNAIAQLTVRKSKQQTDYDVQGNTLRKIRTTDKTCQFGNWKKLDTAYAI